MGVLEIISSKSDLNLFCGLGGDWVTSAYHEMEHTNTQHTHTHTHTLAHRVRLDESVWRYLKVVTSIWLDQGILNKKKRNKQWKGVILKLIHPKCGKYAFQLSLINNVLFQRDISIPLLLDSLHRIKKLYQEKEPLLIKIL